MSRPTVCLGSKAPIPSMILIKTCVAFHEHTAYWKNSRFCHFELTAHWNIWICFYSQLKSSGVYFIIPLLFLNFFFYGGWLTSENPTAHFGFQLELIFEHRQSRAFTCRKQWCRKNRFHKLHAFAIVEMFNSGPGWDISEKQDSEIIGKLMIASKPTTVMLGLKLRTFLKGMNSLEGV